MRGSWHLGLVISLPKIPDQISIHSAITVGDLFALFRLQISVNIPDHLLAVLVHLPLLR